MAQTFTKNIRVTAEEWDRIEMAAEDRRVSANRLVVELTIEALDRREWPRTEAEIHVARASMFVALVLERDLIAGGREDEVEEIRQFISTLLPMPDSEPRPAAPPKARDRPLLVTESGPLSPDLTDLIKRAFRGVHLLAYLKRDELEELDRLEEFESAAEDARIVQDETLGAGDTEQHE